MTTETRIAEPQEFTAVLVKGALWLAVGFGLLKYVLSTLKIRGFVLLSP